MSQPASAPAVDCPSCELSFAPVADRGEAEHLAGVHNDLHHGGHDEAVITDTASSEAGPVALSGLGWLVSASIYEDAVTQALPYTGEDTASERAWSARVDAAVQGMDVLDSAGVDEWMDTHAASPVPHLAEAGLVAAWETHVRSLYDTAETTVTAVELADADAL